MGAACPELSTWLQDRVATGEALPGHLVEAIVEAVRPKSAGVWLAYARQSRARGEIEMADRLVRRASHQLSTTQEAEVLLAISEFTDTPLPDHHSWMWSAKNPPPGLVTRLTTIALEQVRKTLTSAGWITPEQQAWIRARPEIHRQADVLADALMAEQPDDPARLARYADVGFGSRPAAELWLLLVRDPVATVWPTADYHIAKQVRSSCLATLIQHQRWTEVVALLRLYRRAHVEVEWPRDPPTSDQVLATIVSAGQSETAIALAALSGAGPWLIAHGVADPTTHPDWYPDDADTWILRGDPQRLAEAATTMLNDPFANQYDRRQALIWRFAAHLSQGEPSQAQAALDAIVDNDPRVLSGSMSRNLCFIEVFTSSLDAVGQIWNDVRQRLRDDWLTVRGVSDGEWDAPAIAHLTQFDRRCLYFLAYCATAPEAEVSPLALLMALYGGRGGNSDLAQQSNATTLMDLAEVERRCHRRGFGAAIRAWDETGGIDITIETPSAGWWSAYAGIWLAHSQAIDRPRWPDLAVEAWNTAWVDVPRAQQHDLLRQVSELALLSRADTWWAQIREWNSYHELVQDLHPAEPGDPADPQSTVPRVDPWAGVIPPPAVWLAREAWWRTGGAAGTPKQ